MMPSSVQCEKVQTIGVDSFVFTQNENVANRTFLSDGTSIDNLNTDYQKVKEIFQIIECGYFEVSKGRFIEGCQQTAFITFSDGHSQYFESDVVANVRSVNLNENKQISLFDSVKEV